MARKLPFISVVVCCYNGADVLSGCLEALQKQDWKGELEVIVVDDGSVDTTADVAREYNVCLIRNAENRGLAGSRNVGIEAAKGEIVAFTDDDCRPKPDWITELYAGYQRQPDAIGVGGRIEATDHSNIVLRYLHASKPLAPLEKTLLASNSFLYRFGLYMKGLLGIGSSKAAAPRRMRQVYSLVGANMSFRKNALLAVDMFDARFRFGGEEEDLCKRLNRVYSHGLYFVPRATIVHQYDRRLRDTLRRSQAYGKGNARMSRKHADVRPIIYPFPLLLAATALLGLVHPLLFVTPVVLIPLIYARWLVQAVRARQPEALLYSYIQCVQEWYSNVGFVKGWWQFRHMFEPRPASPVTIVILATVGIGLYGLFAKMQLGHMQPLGLVCALLAVILPGYAWLRILRITSQQHVQGWVRAALAVVVGLVWLMALGLGLACLSLVLPGAQTPLTGAPVYIAYLVSLVGLWAVALRTKQPALAEPAPQKAGADTWIITGLAVLLPLLSALGAGLLNNGHTASVTIAMFIAAIVVGVAALIRAATLRSFVIPLVLFMVSLAALWSYSLRSMQVFGWDIQQEYQVAQATQLSGTWELGMAHTPYDAMLSLTVLPALLSEISGASVLALFKVLFPVMFSFLPVIMYVLYRMFAKRWIAFSAALLIIAQFYYMQQFVALARQQVAFLCFAALVYVLLNRQLPRAGRNALIVASIFGLIVSHYSTTYFAIVLLAVAYIGTRAILFLQRDELSKVLRPMASLRLWVVASLIIGAVLWYGPITQSSKGLDGVAEGNYTNVVNKSAALLDAPYATDDHPESTAAYLAYIGPAFRSNHPTFSYYETADNSQIAPAAPDSIPARWPGGVAAVNLTDAGLRFALWGAAVAGIVLFFTFVIYKAERQRLEVAFLALTAIGIFIIAHIIPGLDGFYNVPRVNQQVLLFAALPAVLVIVWCLRGLRERAQQVILGVFAGLSLAIASGLAVTLGGGNPTANLHNYGSDYGRFYIHETDVAAARWLNGVYHAGDAVYADRYASLRLTAHTEIAGGVFQDITPETLARGAFVYSDFTNTTEGVARSGIAIGTETFEYTFPKEFLKQHKDLLYSNGSAEIYQ